MAMHVGLPVKHRPCKTNDSVEAYPFWTFAGVRFTTLAFPGSVLQPKAVGSRET